MANTAGKKLHKEGVNLFRKGKYEAALEKFEAALENAASDTQLTAEIYNDIGVTHKMLDNYAAAHAALDEAMDRFTTLASKKGQAQTLGNRASVYEAEAMPEKAVDTYKEAVVIFEEMGENEMAMYVWQAISRLRKSQGQYIAAIGAYEEGIDNMPDSSFKKKVLRKILGMPNAFLGTGGGSSTPDQDE